MIYSHRTKTQYIYLFIVFLIQSSILLSAQSKLSGIQIINSGTATEISQYGITWTFSKPVEYGTYINGDYWVVGPVEIVNIYPPSKNVAGRVINGSMVNPDPTRGGVHGFDSQPRDTRYSPDLNVARPGGQDLSSVNSLLLQPGSSLVTSISHPEPENRPQLTDAAILTVIAAPPSSGSFRPPYCGSDKTSYYNYFQVDTASLRSLAPVANTPSLSSVTAAFKRPWLDFIPDWTQRDIHASNNMPSYGRDLSSQVSIGALMLHLNYSQNEKKELLVGFLQLGIDLWGIVQNGGTNHWVPNGGHASGRKWPILFAGIMFDDVNMMNLGPGDGSGVAVFGEDAQTFYVSQETIDITNGPDWVKDDKHDDHQPYDNSHLGMPEWGIRHATEPQRDDASWNRAYRTCCTATAWAGFVLSARIMDVVDLWDHDALFDYQDRYMELMNGNPDPFGYPAVNGQPTTHQDYRGWTDFEENMWDAYR
ncbi:hypothetical protein [Marispirochaeta sp.]|uniref:hypothetical protein n=1 Tax=Marispirochaeta sp. TaxID=2038653 RepID=UPI0029C8CA5D|nr:hypothetical protein [Marispirochaeta sp.]